MKRAIFLTAYDRLEYLAPTLESWRNVRGVGDWAFFATVEPSAKQEEVLRMLREFGADLPDFYITLNPTRFGVLHHPWVYFENLFRQGGYDYVVRAEDDITVTTDILEYHEWASHEYQLEPSIGWITSFADDYHDHAEVRRMLGFGSPLIIGTWRAEWTGVFGPSWDHDYSTNNGTPGVHAGWDWNLNRVMPPLGLHSIVPLHTKAFHLGVFGAHSTPDVYFKAPDLETQVPPQSYREVQSCR